jgi:hypothetical protein
VHLGHGSPSAPGKDIVHANVFPATVPESVPVLVRWQELHVLEISGSTDSVVTVPETLAPVCVNSKVTIVVPTPILGFEFESTPVPLQVPARSAGGDGSTGDPLDGDATSGGPLPAPQEVPSTARAVTTRIGRTDFISARREL